MDKSFVRLPKLLIGVGILQQVGKKVAKLGAKNVLFIGDSMFKHRGVILHIASIVKRYNVHVDYHYVEELRCNFINIEMVRKYSPNKSYDLYIGVGGKSILNYTKALAIIANSKNSSAHYLIKRNVLEKEIRTILIPTVVTTGLEVTSKILIYKDGIKMYENNDSYIPSVVYYDPILSIKSSPYETGCACIFNLSRAFELYFFSKNNNLLKTFSLKAIKLILSNIIRATYNKKDIEAHEAIVRAGMLLGMAKQNEKNVPLTYCIAMPIARKMRVPLEIAIAILLPYMTELYRLQNKKHEILREFGIRINDEKKVYHYLTFRLANVIQALGFPTKLSHLNINKQKLFNLSEEAYTLWTIHYKQLNTFKKKDFINVYTKAYIGKIERFPN